MTRIIRNGDSGETVVIAASGTKSSAFDSRGEITWGVFVPTGFEGTEISFEVSHSVDGAFVALSDDTGAAVEVPVAAANAYTLPAALAPWPAFKIVSNATETNERELRIVGKG